MMASRVEPKQRLLAPALVTPFGLAIGLVLYGNFLGLVDSLTAPVLVRSVGAVALGLGIVVVGLRRGLLTRLGLRRGNLWPSLGLGTAVGLIMGLPGVIYLLFGALVPLSAASGFHEPTHRGELALFVFGHLLIATALTEELAFRGLLQTMLKPAIGQRAALLVTACAWAAWHLAVNAHTLASLSAARSAAAVALAFLVQNLAVLAGGLLLGWLREKHDNLAGCILAHWIADILLVGSFYLGGLM